MKQIRKADKRDGWYEISLEEVSRLWEKRPKNRPVTESKCKWLSEVMAGGHYIPNGETVILDENGNVLDGQHRIRAAQIAGVPLQTYVVYVNGNHAKIFDSIDQGKKRSPSDRLAIAGAKNYVNAAALIAALGRYDKGQYDRKPGGSQRPTSSLEARTFYHRNKKVVDLTTDLLSKLSKDYRGMISSSSLGLLHYLAAGYNRTKADQFIEAVATGEQIKKTNPAYAYRARLLDNAKALKKLQSRELLAMGIKAWNAFIQNKPIRNLKFSSNESFPTFCGNK